MVNHLTSGHQLLEFEAKLIACQLLLQNQLMKFSLLFANNQNFLSQNVERLKDTQPKKCRQGIKEASSRRKQTPVWTWTHLL